MATYNVSPSDKSFANSFALCNESGHLTYMTLIYKQAIQSVSNIFASQGHSAIWLTFAVIILLGNFLVLAWRCTRPREQKFTIGSIFVINLATSDFLLGAYMLFYLFLLNYSCPQIAEPKYATLMVALCDISGIIETMSVVLSGFVAATIAVYYATVVFSKNSFSTQCCTFTRTKVVALLIVEWILAIVTGMGLTIPVHGSANFYTTKPQLVYEVDPLSGELVSKNETISAVQGLACLSILSALPYFVNAQGNMHNPAIAAHIVFLHFCGAVVALVAIFIGVAALLYTGIVIKMIWMSSGKRSQLFSALGLGLRLIAIAIINVVCWIAFFFLTLFVSNHNSVYQGLIILSTTAVLNPFLLTILTKSFSKTMKSFVIRLRFKLGRAMRLEDILSESEQAPFATYVPTDSLDD